MFVEPPRRAGRPRRLDEETVLAATVKLLREHGPVGVTARSVAESVGVSRQVVYTQFGSLFGLIDAVYRHGFDQLRDAGASIDAPAGVERVMAHAVAYRAYALANPELYQVMFERPFRGLTPSPASRTAALAAFEPLVDAVASTGRPVKAARDMALTLWAAMHGLVHLELHGYFAAEPSTQTRLADIVTGLLGHAD
jgi:AcrR family transcriptional regulator